MPTGANICEKRNLVKLLGFAGTIIFLLFLLDSRYRVLPDSVHAHLPHHHPGSVLTDITLQKCSSANPFSTCRLDPAKWRRIEKDLYLGKGWLQSAWVHVQRKAEEDLTEEDKVVVGISVGRSSPSLEDGNRDWEQRPGGMWVLRSQRKGESDSHRAVTAVDILFGSDAVDPRPGYQLSQTPFDLASEPIARLSIRHDQAKVEKPVKPRIGNNGRFKILQLSDMHLSTGTGACRHAMGVNNEPSKHCEADPRTLEFVESILDDEKPDLVVLSGDQIEGPAAPDTESAILKFAAPLIERQIPYAVIFGNHDDEGDRSMSRAGQMAVIETLPYSLSQAGPQYIDGIGNYYVEVLAPSPSEHSALTLYLLDSHGLTPDEKNYKGYDWLKQSQIEWFRSTSETLKKAKMHTKYTHIHMDMAFIHIPLPEYAERGSNYESGGEFREPVTAPAFNSHFYDALAQQGVVAVGCGHDHVNDYCALRKEPTMDDDTHHKTPHRGPWMCYAGGSGFGGYGEYNGKYQHRRVRLWEVDTNAGRITTWKRLECCGAETRKKVDDIVIVEGGRVVAPVG